MIALRIWVLCLPTCQPLIKLFLQLLLCHIIGWSSSSHKTRPFLLLLPQGSPLLRVPASHVHWHHANASCEVKGWNDCLRAPSTEQDCDNMALTWVVNYVLIKSGAMMRCQCSLCPPTHPVPPWGWFGHNPLTQVFCPQDQLWTTWQVWHQAFSIIPLSD